MGVWGASNLKKGRQMASAICRGLSHPTRILGRIVCSGQELPKSRKGTLKPDFQAILDIGFLKANVTTRYRKTVI